MTPLPRRQLGRTDRHVRSARLCVNAEAPRHKLAFLAEESLRLCSLPGEEEGRVYYFRYLHVTDLPEDGDRRTWLNAFQDAMREQASRAVHGLHPAAPTREAVYFHNEQEACESLLMHYAAARTPVGWYWPRINVMAQSASLPAQITGIIETLLATPAGWTAAAAAVLSVAQQREVVALLRLLPEESINRWLRELGASSFRYAPPTRFSKSIELLLVRASHTFGAEAPSVLWLAALAVIVLQPSASETQSAVPIARTSLRKVIAETAGTPESTTPRQPSLPARKAIGATQEAATDSQYTIPHDDEQPVEHLRRPANILAATREEFAFGEPTAGAGLYFLLNVLRRLQVENEDFSLVFLAGFFNRIAEHAGIDAFDPILRWSAAIEESTAHEEPGERLLRLWVLRVRRWCWRNGRISVRQIVRRSGYVTLTHTDLDVTLSIDSADIRIRRLGLDLDPGWLPWFGRVVRFHYRYREGHRG